MDLTRARRPDHTAPCADRMLRRTVESSFYTMLVVMIARSRFESLVNERVGDVIQGINEPINSALLFFTRDAPRRSAIQRWPPRGAPRFGNTEGDVKPEG